MDSMLETDLRRLDGELSRLLGDDAGFLETLRGSNDVRILDLACGACDEAEVLTRRIARLRGDELPETAAGIRFTGMDIRAREIGWARERFRGEGAVSYEFLEGDARRLDGHSQLPEQFDLVFMRHQNLWNGRRVWEEIYHKALEKLSPGGRLVITSYFDREHEQALAAIQAQGGKLLVTHRNPFSRELATPGKSVDRHLAVLQKT
ncbi:MAG: SAM-dependent methyltransferase [Verrucomicrobia bacterium]|jgi:SAM-dependent methyltransferase|nr:MAG: SAM-dependent methyltransferase [Verrucomicrobiota bacterium]